MSVSKKDVDLLRILAKSDPRVVRGILKTADVKLINLLSECALNILNKNVPVSNKRKNMLKKYKKQMEKLAYGKLKLNGRKRILQTGGFLSILLSTILPTILKLLK